jgi:hypothetical protein
MGRHHPSHHEPRARDGLMEQDQVDEVGSLVTEAISRHRLAGLAVAVIRPDAPPVMT